MSRRYSHINLEGCLSPRILNPRLYAYFSPYADYVSFYYFPEIHLQIIIISVDLNVSEIG